MCSLTQRLCVLLFALGAKHTCSEHPPKAVEATASLGPQVHPHVCGTGLAGVRAADHDGGGGGAHEGSASGLALPRVPPPLTRFPHALHAPVSHSSLKLFAFERVPSSRSWEVAVFHVHVSSSRVRRCSLVTPDLALTPCRNLL